MVTHISLVQETRYTEFSSATGEAPILGQYIVEDYEETKSFGFQGTADDPASSAKVVFRMPFPLAQKVLPRRERPQERVYFWQTARYAEMAIGYTKPRTWLIQGGIVEEIGANIAMVTLNLKSPIAWIADYPSLAGSDGKDITASRVSLLEQLTKPVSDQSIDLEGTGKRLPIKPLLGSWTPSAAQLAAGYVKASDVDPGGTLTIPNPYPLSVFEAIAAVMVGWSDGIGTYGLTLVEESTPAGPYWRFAMWKHMIAPVSYTLQQLGLESIEFSNRFTDVLTYDEDNPQDHRYIGGPRTLRNPYMNGAWLSVEFEGFKKQDPDGVLPPGSQPPSVDYGFGDNGVGSWGPGSGLGGDSGFTNPGGAPDVTAIEGNTLLPTSDGLINPAGGMFNDSIDPRDVSFLVNVTDQNDRWILPTGSAGTAAFGWDIYVDGQFIESYTIPAGGSPQKIVMLPTDGADHVITLKPTGGTYATGIWERIGYSSTTSGGPKLFLKQILALGKESYRNSLGVPRNLQDQWNNCANMTRVANPDSYFSHATIPSGFEYRRFQGNVKLEYGVEPAVDFSIAATGAVPNNFRAQTYQFCYELKKFPNIAPLLNVTEIGNTFYYSFGASCTKAMFPQAFQRYANVTKVGDAFFMDAFSRNSSSPDSTPPDSLRDLLPNVETIGNTFFYQWLGGSTQASAHVAEKIVIPLMPKLKTIGDSAFHSFGAKSKTSKASGVEMDPMPDWPLLEGVGTNFMHSFARNSDIRESLIESTLPSLKSFGAGYLANSMAWDSGNGLIAVYYAEKFPAGYVLTTVTADYRSAMYSRSRDLTAAKQAWPMLETATKTMTKGSGYRTDGMRYNGYTGGSVPDAGGPNRIKYTDSTDVIASTNGIPSRFYA